MAASSVVSRAKEGSILHLLRQREMEFNECKIEKLGGRITRSVIIQVSTTSTVRQYTYFRILTFSRQWSFVLCGVDRRRNQCVLDLTGEFTSTNIRLATLCKLAKEKVPIESDVGAGKDVEESRRKCTDFQLGYLRSISIQ